MFLVLGDLIVEMGFSESHFRIYEAKFHLSVMLDA